MSAYALGDLSALFTRPLRNFMQILLFLGCLIQKPLSQSFAIARSLSMLMFEIRKVTCVRSFPNWSQRCIAC